MDLGLTGKTALVSAASKGLGLATARELVREGARVMINSHDPANLETALASLREELGAGIPVTAHAADLTDPEAVAGLVAATAREHGGLDILVTNNGGPPAGSLESTDIDAWRAGLELTLMSAVHLVRSALPHLKTSDAASVLTITSVSVKQPVPGLFLSNVIRPAVVGLTKAIAQELGRDHGIRANSILPGWTATERVGYILQQRAEAAGTTPDEESQKVAANVPLGRMAEPEEFGRVAAFLASPAASYLNGAMIQLDGGAYGGLL
ncbi:SDR family oxidoreductase [bacterium]|nr:SDR family oxidoreductase [bacterium]